MHKGWFVIPGVQDGDRTVEEQLTGLGAAERFAMGRSVLEFGCAEGLLLKHLVEKCGANCGHGLSLVASEIEVGRVQCQDVNVELHVCDLNGFVPWRNANRTALQAQYDVVLLLSILHKLKKPLVFLEMALEYATQMVAVRLPQPVIQDARSGYKAFDVRPVLARHFELVESPRGVRGEWTSIWLRK